MHPHLNAGLRQLTEGLGATNIEGIVDGWADAVLAECERVAIGSYVLIGASLGGLLAHLVGLSARRRGKPGCSANKGLVLIDPAPSVHLSKVPLPGVRGAATYLAMHSIGFDLDFLEEVGDGDLAMKLAARRAELGLAPFTEQTVLENQRELRATTHLLNLATAYQTQPKLSIPSTESRVWLTLSEGRPDFFLKAGLTAAEASPAAAQKYGSIAQELIVPGGHLEVCQRCMIGDMVAFNELLQRAMDEGSGHDASDAASSKAGGAGQAPPDTPAGTTAKDKDDPKVSPKADRRSSTDTTPKKAGFMGLFGKK
uniref:AB hydrolase-1 domain-containing protein n=1 Tax=Haptolina brevifila TaxID=156173 RepID=A0A7S2HJZ0_9EUKA|mmetsp:Transcript_55444/g.110129  ORF Transcript_55444/g.110129 Transcript_55444/m.110129 type:complete len:312 (+) Transcript_55444:53-988(+)